MKSLSLLLLFIILNFTQILSAQNVSFKEENNADTLTFQLQNKKVKQSVVIENKRLFSDSLLSLSPWTLPYGRPTAVLASDGNFTLRVVWNGWRAPGKMNNADNPVTFTKNDFLYRRFSVVDTAGGKELKLIFKGINNPFKLEIAYLLLPDKFYVHRRISISDSKQSGHFLDRIEPRRGKFLFKETTGGAPKTTAINIEGIDFAYTKQIDQKTENNTRLHIVKYGGFGQPAAFAGPNSGGFIGLEYPTGTTRIQKLNGNLFFAHSFQYIGHRIKNEPLAGNWEVTAITPQPYVKKWFFRYVDDIRVAPAKPYILYNSWYDLRSEHYAAIDKKIPKDAIMNDTNTLRIIRLLRKNMIRDHHIHLDAFVLDDGWDNYESPWALNRHEFPHGLRPIADTLAKTGTRLGIWYGPTGGYSFAMKRVKWMGTHGYEVTGHKYVYGSAQMCLAGKNYSRLFKKRTTAMVQNDRVGYFKWDGIQFSCSNPNHGHPVGIYSRRAVMQSVIDKCNAVRAIDPHVYLNITSGTWLSPWWLQYANQIWMDAADYAFSDVPSISRRDNAMTYRDYGLYNDFVERDMWIPIANLMTHGIIKGRLENISKGGEPTDRFTNNAVLYFARGITMWELYISPDILTQREWNILSQAIQWAKSVQNIMTSTYFTGGNPAHGETYGYLHFRGNKGIIAVRNPKITADSIRLPLFPRYGLNENAKSLIVEQIYPYRKILPGMYSSGGSLTVPLSGFETAIFRIFPENSTQRPLLCHAVFTLKADKNHLHYTLSKVDNDVHFIQEHNIQSIRINGKPAQVESLSKLLKNMKTSPHYSITVHTTGKNYTFRFEQPPTNNKAGELALLLTPTGKEKDFPTVTFIQNGQTLMVHRQSMEGKWAWYSVKPLSDHHAVSIVVNRKNWQGKAAFYVQNITKYKPVTVDIQMKNNIPYEIMPPMPFPVSEIHRYIPVKSFSINSKQ